MLVCYVCKFRSDLVWNKPFWLWGLRINLTTRITIQKTINRVTNQFAVNYNVANLKYVISFFSYTTNTIFGNKCRTFSSLMSFLKHLLLQGSNFLFWKFTIKRVWNVIQIIMSKTREDYITITVCSLFCRTLVLLLAETINQSYKHYPFTLHELLIHIGLYISIWTV